MRSSRTLRVWLAMIAAMSLVLIATGCEKKVEVRTGERVTCTYGHVISDSVKTVEVPASKVSRYRVKERTETCAKHLEAERIYKQAQELLAKGDIKGATPKLEQVVRIDAAFGRAASQLSSIRSGQKPVADMTDPSASAPSTGTAKAPTDATPAGALEAYIPDQLKGFTARDAATDPMSVSRMYAPSATSKLLVLTVVAEQFKTEAGASAALKQSIEPSYASGVAKVTVGGKQAFFGTNGSDVAVVAFTDGPVLVVFEGVAKSGIAASKLSAELVAAAEQVR